MFRVESPLLSAEYPNFLGDISGDLGLTSTEQRIVFEARPEIWAAWSHAVLSGGEHTPTTSRKELSEQEIPFFAAPGELQGQPVLDFRKGRLARRVESIYASTAPADQARFKHLSRRLASWTFTIADAVGLNSSEWINFSPLFPQTLIRPEADSTLRALFANSELEFPVDEPVESVISFGPGLTGAQFAAGLLGYSRNVHLVSGGIGAEYVNSSNECRLLAEGDRLEDYRRSRLLRAMLPPNVDARTVRMPEVRHYSDGIAAGVGALAAQNSLDLAVMSSVHTAGVEECHAGITQSAERLRTGGLFILKAPDVSIGDEAGMDRMIEHIPVSLGDPVVQAPCGTLQQNIVPKPPYTRSASVVIYRKK